MTCGDLISCEQAPELVLGVWDLCCHKRRPPLDGTDRRAVKTPRTSRETVVHQSRKNNSLAERRCCIVTPDDMPAPKMPASDVGHAWRPDREPLSHRTETQKLPQSTISTQNTM